MAHPVTEELFGGPCDGARVVPTSNDMVVQYTVTKSAIDPDWSCVKMSEFGPRKARYVSIKGRFVHRNFERRV